MSKASEQIEMTTYSIWRTGGPRIRRYQVNKRIAHVDTGERYWVELKGRDEFYCDCPGFRIQTFPKVEHKHVKIAMDFNERGEPDKALYKIHGTGAKTEIEYLGTLA